MDYTITGNEVTLAARLQSAAEPGGILISHETNALVQDIVLTEEQPPMTVKGLPALSEASPALEVPSRLYRYPILRNQGIATIRRAREY